jgi:tetratricopeptide (TPR) repeat protein
VLAGLGEFIEAHSLAEENSALCKDLGFKGDMAYALCVQGFTELHYGEYEQARAHAEQCIVLAREIGYRWGVGFSLWHLGCADLAREACVEARQWLQESVAVFRALEQRDDLAWPLSVLGISALTLNKPRLAEQCLSEALQITVKIGGIFSLMHTLPAAALFAADQGSAERAVELYAVASRFPYVADSRWFEDVVGRRIATIAAALPPEVVAAAQERGRARDPAATAAELLDELGT